MKKVLLGVLGVVVLGAVGLGVAASMQPDMLQVERSVTVAATPADVFPFANNYEKWQLWNPWREMDPNQKETLSEQKEGVGARYAWEGNDDVGKGEMIIKESVPDEKVVEDLHFIEPFESRAVVTFTVAPEGDKTKVTWGFESKNDFMGKAFGLFVDMDAMLGADFQRGLDKMKPLAEAEATKRLEAERAAAEAAAAAVTADAAAAGGTFLEGTAPEGDPAAQAAK